MLLYIVSLVQKCNFNLFEILKFNISYFKKFENLKCNYDVVGDLMNINEADQTYSHLVNMYNSNC